MARRAFLIYTRKNQVLFKFMMMFVCVLIIVLVLPKGGKFKYEFEKGKPWMHETLIAPFDFAIEKSEEDILVEKNSVINAIVPYYSLSEKLIDTVKAEFHSDFNKKWAVKYGIRNETVKRINRTFCLEFLQGIYKNGIIVIDYLHKDKSADMRIYVLNGYIAEASLIRNHFTREAALNLLRSKLENNRDMDSALILSVFENVLRPNLQYNEGLTQKVIQEEISNISLSRGMVQKDEVIIEKGTIVDLDKFQMLESFRNEYQRRSSLTGNKSIISIGQFLLVSLIIILLMVFLALFRKDVFKDNRQMFLILMIVTIMLVVLSWAIKLNFPTLYFIPYCIVPIIIRVLFDTRLALYIHLLVVIIAGFFVPNGFEFVFLQITAGMVAIYSIKTLLKRSQFLVSAVLIFLTYSIAFIGISIIHEGIIASIRLENLWWFAVSVVLTLLAYPLIYAFERLFQITTEVTLMELTNTNNSLLRELSFKAPGTFQHSLQVANLAEAAIYQIGGNSLLVRAAALYHDIGKMENPAYFIENQSKGINPHDNVTYEESAKIIIQHVYKGVELARKFRMPESIIDFIKTHHGNTRVDYFYQSYLKNYPEKLVDENVFRYPGPIPFTREQAVLMLADSVEAASRSLKEPDAENIDLLVERIIDYKLEQNQLINSDITIREIAIVKKIFKNMLMSIYHIRIDYQTV